LKDFNQNWNVLKTYSKTQIQNFKQMRYFIGVKLLHADRQTNPQSSRRIAIQNFFLSAPKNRLLSEIEPVLSISNFNYSVNRDIPHTFSSTSLRPRSTAPLKKA